MSATEPAGHPARRAVFKRLGIALASLVLFLGLAEGVARLLYETPWHARLVAEQRAGEELEYERNRYNLRGPDYQYPKPAGTRRILMIGDSFTFGMGVARYEDVFARICERRLNETLELGGVERVELLNGSIMGSLTYLWTEVWRKLSVLFDPDVVVFVFFLRDGTRAGSVPEFFDVIRDELAAHNARSRLYRHSYLFRFWKDARDAEAIRTHYTRLFRDAYFGDEVETAEWGAAQHNLKRMLKAAEARGCRVGFVIFPVLAGLDAAPYPFQDIVDLLDEFARQAGFEVHDLLPAFRGLDGPSLWVSPFDQHPNERAHAIAADSLLPFLERLLEEHEADRAAR